MNQSEEPIQQPKVLELSGLRAGESPFLATGWSFLKVTRGGVITILKLPIQSSGVADVMERLKESEPRPPIKPVLVDPNSPIGRNLKLTERKWVQMPDLGDEEYIRATDKHQTRVAFAVVLAGLNVPIYDEANRPVEDSNQKIEILRKLGLSTEQFTQLVQDIQALTQLTEDDRLSFFGKSSDSTKNGG